MLRWVLVSGRSLALKRFLRGGAIGSAWAEVSLGERAVVVSRGRLRPGERVGLAADIVDRGSAVKGMERCVSVKGDEADPRTGDRLTRDVAGVVDGCSL